MRATRILAVPLLVLVLAGAAACQHGDDSTDGVASADGGKATASASASTSTVVQAQKYAECIRQHGVPDFPDPGPDGRFTGGFAKNLDRNKLVAAMEACQDLATGNISKATGQMTADQAEKFRAYAGCMREHGIDLPDPDPNQSLLTWAQSWQSKVKTGDPNFKSSSDACQKELNINLGAGVR
jgi:hypothetical protein